MLTGDALFYQRKLCAQVLAAGADFLVLVKERQTTLLVATSLLFDPPATLGPAALVASSYAVGGDELLAGYRRCYVADPFSNRMECGSLSSSQPRPDVQANTRATGESYPCISIYMSDIGAYRPPARGRRPAGGGDAAYEPEASMAWGRDGTAALTGDGDGRAQYLLTVR